MSSKKRQSAPATQSQDTQQNPQQQSGWGNADLVEQMKAMQKGTTYKSSASRMMGSNAAMQEWLQAGPENVRGLRGSTGINASNDFGVNLFGVEGQTTTNGGITQLGETVSADGNATFTGTNNPFSSSVEGGFARSGEGTSANGQLEGGWRGDDSALGMSVAGNRDAAGHHGGSVGLTGQINSEGSSTNGGIHREWQDNGRSSTGVSLANTTDLGSVKQTLRGAASVDQDGKVKANGSVGLRSSNTHQEGDSLVTDTAHLGANGSIGKKPTIGGEVGLSRRIANEESSTTYSGKGTANNQGVGLNLSASHATENARASGSLGYQVGPDGRTTTLSAQGNASTEAWRGQTELAEGVTAKARVLGADASAKASTQFGPKGTSATVETTAGLTLAEGQIKARRELLKIEEFGLDGDGSLSAAIEARAKAKAKAAIGKDGAEFSASADAFIGAKAEATAGATLTWDRLDDYSAALKDVADSLPGNFDDVLLDQLPEGFWSSLSDIMFGEGKTDLARVGVGVDARAGAGANASASAKVDNNGMIDASADAGAAVGLGAGAKLNVGINPVDLVRRSLLEHIRNVNSIVGGGEWIIRKLTGLIK